MPEGSHCYCLGCGARFRGPSDRDRHKVYNAAIAECWARWCLSEFGMAAIGMVEANGVWAVPPGGIEGPP